MIQRAYRVTAALCAEIVARTPLKQRFVEVGV
jgi:hypothetical protein